LEADGVSKVAVRIEPLTRADIASAVELAVRVLRVKAGDRGEQFAAGTGLLDLSSCPGSCG